MKSSEKGEQIYGKKNTIHRIEKLVAIINIKKVKKVKEHDSKCDILMIVYYIKKISLCLFKITIILNKPGTFLTQTKYSKDVVYANKLMGQSRIVSIVRKKGVVYDSIEETDGSIIKDILKVTNKPPVIKPPIDITNSNIHIKLIYFD